jgi:hypothetical protein
MGDGNVDMTEIDNILGGDADDVAETLELVTRYKPRERRRRTRGKSMDVERQKALAPGPITPKTPLTTANLDDQLFGFGSRPSRSMSMSVKPLRVKKKESNEGKTEEELRIEEKIRRKKEQAKADKAASLLRSPTNKSELYEDVMRKKEAAAARRASEKLENSSEDPAVIPQVLPKPAVAVVDTPAAVVEPAASPLVSIQEIQSKPALTVTTSASKDEDSDKDIFINTPTPGSSTVRQPLSTRSRARSRRQRLQSAPVNAQTAPDLSSLDGFSSARRQMQREDSESSNFGGFPPPRRSLQREDSESSNFNFPTNDETSGNLTPRNSSTPTSYNSNNNNNNNNNKLQQSGDQFGHSSIHPPQESHGPFSPRNVKYSQNQNEFQPNRRGAGGGNSSHNNVGSHTQQNDRHRSNEGRRNDANTEYLNSKITAQAATIEELNKRNSVLMQDLASAHVNAQSMVSETRKRQDRVNEDELRRANDQLTSKRQELEREREAHSETRRMYDTKLRTLTMELTSVNNASTIEADERARGQLDQAYKQQEVTLEHQRQHFEREFDALKQMHTREVEALKRQMVDSSFLKSLASKVQNSANVLDTLHERVHSDRHLTEQATLNQVNVRQALLKEKELKLEESHKQHQDMLGTFHKLQSENESERARLKNEHFRVKQLQRDVTAQSTVLREQLTTELDAAVKDRADLKAERQEWSLEKRHKQNELATAKDMTNRTRNQLGAQIHEAKKEHKELMRQLDTERRELSQYKKNLLMKKTLLDDRIEALRAKEIQFKKHVHYVETNMNQLTQFGAKVKKQSKALAQSWKTARAEMAASVQLKEDLNTLQIQLTLEQDRIGAEQRVLDKERAVFERRRLGWMKDQKLTRTFNSSQSQRQPNSSSADGFPQSQQQPENMRPGPSSALLAQKSKLSQSLSRPVQQTPELRQPNWQTKSVGHYNNAETSTGPLQPAVVNTSAAAPWKPTQQFNNYMSLDQLALQQQLDAMEAEANEMQEFLMQEEHEIPLTDDSGNLSTLTLSSEVDGPTSISKISHANSTASTVN